MREELTCITCPMGCRLVVEGSPNGEGGLAVSGNRCPRGAAYAREELLAPKRTVTATCRVRAAPAAAGGFGSRAAARETARRIPCRTTAPFPKDRVEELLAAIYALEEPLPVTRGRVLIRDALGLGIDVIATRTLGAE
jgi:CxxC motif-containing protein